MALFYQHLSYVRENSKLTFCSQKKIEVQEEKKIIRPSLGLVKCGCVCVSDRRGEKDGKIKLMAIWKSQKEGIKLDR